MHRGILHYESDSKLNVGEKYKTYNRFLGLKFSTLFIFLGENFFRALYNLITPDIDFFTPLTIISISKP